MARPARKVGMKHDRIALCLLRFRIVHDALCHFQYEASRFGNRHSRIIGNNFDKSRFLNARQNIRQTLLEIAEMRDAESDIRRRLFNLDGFLNLFRCKKEHLIQRDVPAVLLGKQEMAHS